MHVGTRPCTHANLEHVLKILGSSTRSCHSSLAGDSGRRGGPSGMVLVVNSYRSLAFQKTKYWHREDWTHSPWGCQVTVEESKLVRRHSLHCTVRVWRATFLWHVSNPVLKSTKGTWGLLENCVHSSGLQIYSYSTRANSISYSVAFHSLTDSADKPVESEWRRSSESKYGPDTS